MVKKKLYTGIFFINVNILKSFVMMFLPKKQKDPTHEIMSGRFDFLTEMAMFNEMSKLKNKGTIMILSFLLVLSIVGFFLNMAFDFTNSCETVCSSVCELDTAQAKVTSAQFNDDDLLPE